MGYCGLTLVLYLKTIVFKYSLKKKKKQQTKDIKHRSDIEDFELKFCGDMELRRGGVMSKLAF